VPAGACGTRLHETLQEVCRLTRARVQVAYSTTAPQTCARVAASGPYCWQVLWAGLAATVVSTNAPSCRDLASDPNHPKAATASAHKKPPPQHQ